MVSKNTICLWYDGTALDAATFYAKTFPDSAVGEVHRAPGDFPSGKEGDVLTVEGVGLLRPPPPCMPARALEEVARLKQCLHRSHRSPLALPNAGPVRAAVAA